MVQSGRRMHPLGGPDGYQALILSLLSSVQLIYLFTFKIQKIMAKSRSFFGLRRGSTKSLTFQILNGLQITKDRVTQVRNPKTSGQIMQRMKLSAANVIYRYFKPYVDRGQQGVSYGNLSRQAWLKQILLSSALYNPKGANVLLPWSFPLTKGSLTPFAYTWDGESNIRIDLEGQNQTLVTTDDILLDLNKQLQSGDQITVIVMAQLPGGQFQLYQASHIIGNNANIYDVMNENGIDITPITKTVGEDSNTYAVFQPLNGTVTGTAIILSRLNGAAYERSTQSFIGSDEMFNDNFRSMAIDSYRDKSATSTDWPEVVEGGFIPFGKTTVQVVGGMGEHTTAFAALAIYGFAGNEYRLYAVTSNGQAAGNLYNAQEAEQDEAPANSVSVGTSDTPLTGYVYGFISKADFDKLY